MGLVIGGGASLMLRETLRVRWLRRHGVQAWGVITAIRTDTDGDGDLQHYPQVNYQLPDDTPTSGEAMTGSPHSCVYEVGDEVDIIHHPRDPSQTLVHGHDGIANKWAFGFAALITGLTAALCIATGLASLAVQ
ncbi:DUF3592 domain-containing protein [Streptomyces sp. AV19]|uniref:DUF3592 domain-containing protein n=1 Tax=Streptomyces sp. AV19 TaxID=2793068 RepID=UPI0035AC2149